MENIHVGIAYKATFLSLPFKFALSNRHLSSRYPTGGSLHVYHTDLGTYGPEFADAATIYWPKKYELVTHIYLKNRAVVFAIY